MSFLMKEKVSILCDKSTVVVDRQKNGDVCPKCGYSAEIFLWDFSTNKDTFDDLWSCRSRDCGFSFLMRTKRK